MNAAQRTAVGKNIFNGLSSKFFSRSANVNRVSSQFRNADCALQQGGVAELEKGLVGAHARAFSTGEYKCSHHGESVTNYKLRFAYRTRTVVSSLMSFEELPIINLTGSASTLN